MPRRTAAERHRDTAPDPHGPEVIEQLIAYHHPTRQRILEALSLHGPASVGQLAERCGVAPGSISHHLKSLHRGGFVEPAPELAADTRASWWRVRHTSVAYDALDYPVGSPAREVAALAERANDQRHVAAMTGWRARRAELPERWRRAGGSIDSSVAATPAQIGELLDQLDEVIRAWALACHEDRALHPDAERRPVLAFAHVVPTFGTDRG